MFSFLKDTDNYEDRKVARFEQGDVLVSTARVSDSLQPFETAVAHPDYNNGKLVIVQMYDTKEEASIGHNKWVKLMTSDNLPDELVDVSTAEIRQLLGGGEIVYVRNKNRQ